MCTLSIDEIQRPRCCHLSMLSFTTPLSFTFSSFSLAFSLSLSLRSAPCSCSKMLARIAANRFNEIRHIFRQVFPPFSLSFSHSVFRFLSIFLFDFFLSQPSRAFSTALNYVSALRLRFNSLSFRFVILIVNISTFR